MFYLVNETSVVFNMIHLCFCCLKTNNIIPNMLSLLTNNLAHSRLNE